MTQEKFQFNHVSVLLNECIENLKINPDGVYVDGTLGGGGHSKEICKRLSYNGTLIGIDRDKDALEAAEEILKDYSCHKIFVHSNYSQIKDRLKELKRKGLIKESKVNGILLDLGVSSFQLDNSQRGFSYMQEAPLDMRMNQDDKFSAYDVVNQYKEKDIYQVISQYGEERWAKRIASFIVEARREKPIETTLQLVDIIKAAIPVGARRDGPHPAKRTFQAIRIEVNDELGQLKAALEDMCDCLEPKGRLCVISFHSLEDRIAKDVISKRADPCTCPKEFPICVCGKVADIRKISRKPILPEDGEIQVNPRARSAKLRVCEKI